MYSIPNQFPWTTILHLGCCALGKTSHQAIKPSSNQFRFWKKTRWIAPRVSAPVLVGSFALRLPAGRGSWLVPKSHVLLDVTCWQMWVRSFKKIKKVLTLAWTHEPQLVHSSINQFNWSWFIFLIVIDHNYLVSADPAMTTILYRYLQGGAP